jgi:hypothetical protein
MRPSGRWRLTIIPFPAALLARVWWTIWGVDAAQAGTADGGMKPLGIMRVLFLQMGPRVRTGAVMRTVLLVLNVLVLGGCIALVLVWRLLTRAFAGNVSYAEPVWETLTPLFNLYLIGLVAVLVVTMGYGVWGGLRAERRSPGKPQRDETRS